MMTVRRRRTTRRFALLAGMTVVIALGAAIAATSQTARGSSSATYFDRATANSPGDSIYNGLKGKPFVYLYSGFSGAYIKASVNGPIKGFASRTGMHVTTDNFCCGITKLAGMTSAHN